MLQIAISGLAEAAIIALLASGIVTIFRATRVMNFAEGDLGMLAAFAVYSLSMIHGLPVAVYIAAGIIAGAAFGVVISKFLLRKQRRSVLNSVVVTLGVSVAFQGIALAVWGAGSFVFPQWMGTGIVRIGSLTVGVGTVGEVVIAAGVLLVWAGILHFTRWGVAFRATSEDSEVAELYGISSQVVHASAWGIGGALAALCALLIAPVYNLTVTTVDSFILYAFMAVLLGGLSSIRGTLVMSLVIGLGSSFLNSYVSTLWVGPILGLAVIAILYVRPNGLGGTPTLSPESRGQIARPSVRTVLRDYDMHSTIKVLERLERGAGVGIGAILVLLPLIVSGVLLSQFALVGIDSIALFGLVVLIGLRGEVTLGQGAFMAMGAYTASIIEVSLHLPFIVGWIAAVAAAGLVGLFLAVPLLRLVGPYVGLVTWIFAWSLPSIIGNLTSLTDGYNGHPAPDVSMFGFTFASYAAKYYLVLAVTALVGLAVWQFKRGTVGRVLVAGRAAPRGVQASGLSVARGRLLAFSVAAVLAGLAGALQASVVNYVAPTDFPYVLSILLFGMIIVGGGDSLIGAVLAAALLVLVPYFVGGLQNIQYLIFGGTIVAAGSFLPNGIGGLPALMLSKALALRVWRARSKIEGKSDTSTVVVGESLQSDGSMVVRGGTTKDDIPIAVSRKVE